ncbi:NAD-dependent epimerase/dehydratase family protein [Aquirufa ecclesiirivi]
MITVLGASGFVGSSLVNLLKDRGEAYYTPQRNDDLFDRDLGHVIYCIGMTADFRTKPFDTIESHVCKLSGLLQNAQFDSLTYLSSTRIYINTPYSKTKVKEEDSIIINSINPSDIFAASKMTGELLALNSGRENIKIVRLSNVFGDDFYSENFITSVIKEALTKYEVKINSSPDSAKDYIAIEDVCQSLFLLANLNITGVFNLAYGSNISNEDLLSEIARLTDSKMCYAPDAPRILFTEIDTSKLEKVIQFKPERSVLSSLPKIVQSFRSKM